MSNPISFAQSKIILHSIPCPESSSCTNLDNSSKINSSGDGKILNGEVFDERDQIDHVLKAVVISKKSETVLAAGLPCAEGSSEIDRENFLTSDIGNLEASDIVQNAQKGLHRVDERYANTDKVQISSE